MRKPLILASVFSFILLLAPLGASLHWAKREAYRQEVSYAQTVASELLRRAALARQQVGATWEALKRSGPASCSPAAIDAMRRLSMNQSYVKDVGVIRDGRLMCSTLGQYGNGIELGESRGQGPVGRHWQSSTLPYAVGQIINLFEHEGWVVMVHNGLLEDIAVRAPDMTAAIFTIEPLQRLQLRGPFHSSWLGHYRPGESGVVNLPGYLLVFEAAREENLFTLISVPRVGLDERMREQLLVLLPVSAIAGLLLVAVVVLVTRRHTNLSSEIRYGLRHRQFHLHYQPVVDLKTGRYVGAEALLRWRRPDGAQVSPDLFIPVAERSGLIQSITSYVIKTAVRDLPALLDAQPDFHLGLNFSALDLEAGESVNDLITLLAKLPQRRDRTVVVEITERGVADADVATPQITKLHAAGVTVAVDDFGTGHSSLSVLANLKLDFLKIDKMFVSAIDQQAPASQVLAHIIEMAKTLNLEMIAEGIETEAQATYLRERGVQYAQGWLYGKPMPMAQLLALLRGKS